MAECKDSDMEGPKTASEHGGILWREFPLDWRRPPKDAGVDLRPATLLGEYERPWYEALRARSHPDWCINSLRKHQREMAALMFNVPEATEENRREWMLTPPITKRRLQQESDARWEAQKREAIEAVWNGTATPEQVELEKWTDGRIAECGGTGRCRKRCPSCVAAKTCNHWCPRFTDMDTAFAPLVRAMHADAASVLDLSTEGLHTAWRWDGPNEADMDDGTLWLQLNERTVYCEEGDPRLEMEECTDVHLFRSGERKGEMDVDVLAMLPDEYRSALLERLRRNHRSGREDGTWYTHVSWKLRDVEAWTGKLWIPRTSCTSLRCSHPRLYCPCDS